MKNFLLIPLIFLLTSCNEDPEKCGDTTINYVNTIQDIIESSCNNGSCHVGSNGGWAVLPDFSSYDNLLPHLESGIIDSRINTADSSLIMPPVLVEDRQISNADLILLNDWICNGFPEG